MVASPRASYARMKSILEVPLLNERYLLKAPSMPADAVMLDLEESLGPDQKTAARQRLAEIMQNADFFAGKRIIVRVNNLASPWGGDDLASIAKLTSEVVICYPKVEAVDEMRELASRVKTGFGCCGVYAMIETAKAVMQIGDIAKSEGLVGLHFGYIDYAADVGCKLFADSGDDLFGPAMNYPRSKLAIAAAANGLFSTGGSLLPEYRDLAKVETLVRSWANLGYTACIAVAPSHLEVVNRVMTPSASELAAAKLICETYEKAVALGKVAASMHGRLVTFPDYRAAQTLIERGREARI